MTKQELMENYTAEQLAEMVVKANNLMDMLKYSDSFLKSGLFDNPAVAAFESKINIMQHENDRLQAEVEKYRKAFEGAKKERDCQIAEYQKKIEELTTERDFISKDSISAYQEPIEIAKDLINAEGEYEYNPITKAFCGTDKDTYRIFEVSELRQIAEHLLVYCNHNEEAEE